MSEFVEIIGYPNYEINRKGVVRNIKTGNVLKGGIGNAGYLQVRLTNSLGITLTWGVHRLLAWVFLAKFGNITGLVINHIDGNKLNNEFSNLYICSRNKHSKVHYSCFRLVQELMERGLVYFDKEEGVYNYKDV